MNVPTYHWLKSLTWVLVLGVAALVGLIIYQNVALSLTARQAQTQSEQLADLKRQTAEREAARSTRSPLLAHVPQHAAPWSWNEQLPSMVAEVSRVAKGSGAVIDTVQPAPVVERQHLARFPLRITLHADLATLSKLLQRVQKAEPALGVDHMAIRPGQKPGEPLQVDLTLAAYVLIDGRQPAGGRP